VSELFFRHLRFSPGGLTLLSILSLFSMSTLALGDSSALVETSEALQEATIHERSFPMTVSISTMVLGPALNNLDGQVATPSAPAGGRASSNHPIGPALGANGAKAGYSNQYLLSSMYHFDDIQAFGVVFAGTEAFYPPERGALQMNDPQLRYTLDGMGAVRTDSYRFVPHYWFSVYLPVSETSQEMHTFSAVSASWIPKLFITGSRFSFDGLLSARVSMISRKDGESMVLPTRLNSALQANYRLSNVVTNFMTGIVSTSAGPGVPIDDDLSSFDPSGSKRAPHPLSIMEGAIVRPSSQSSFTVSPRLNWYIDQPLKMTSVGLTANIQLL